jgi:hypothetical protein
MAVSSTNERLVSTLFGIGVGGSQLYVALCHISEPDMKIAAIAIAVATGFGAYRFVRTWRTSKILGVVLLVGIACGEIFGQVQTAERILVVREERARAVKTENQPHAMATRRVDSAKQELQRAIDTYDKALAEVTPLAKLKLERRQNEKNANDKRTRLSADVQTKRDLLASAERDLLKLEAPKIETKLAAKLGVAADVIDLGIAGLISFTMLAFMLVFLGMGHNNAKPQTTVASNKTRGRPMGAKDSYKRVRRRKTAKVVQFPNAVTN